jgi:hypothetical protein
MKLKYCMLTLAVISAAVGMGVSSCDTQGPAANIWNVPPITGTWIGWAMWPDRIDFEMEVVETKTLELVGTVQTPIKYVIDTKNSAVTRGNGYAKASIRFYAWINYYRMVGDLDKAGMSMSGNIYREAGDGKLETVGYFELNKQ